MFDMSIRMTDGLMPKAKKQKPKLWWLKLIFIFKFQFITSFSNYNYLVSES